MIYGNKRTEADTLKAFDKAITRFLYKHPRFGIKNLMLYVIIGQILVYLIGIMDTTGTLYSLIWFDPALILKGEVWRAFTFIFIPPVSGLLGVFGLFLSLYFDYFIMLLLQSRWGVGRFTIYYLLGILSNIVYGVVLYLIGIPPYSLNTSFLHLSLFFALATIFPDMPVRLFFFLNVRIKWLAIVDAIYFVYATIIYFPILPFFPLIPILNYLLFFGYVIVEKVFKNGKGAARSAVFKSKTLMAESEVRGRPYRHKCEICGKTDVSDPDMDFRYCSRCSGYHCYCMDHINNHVHITE